MLPSRRRSPARITCSAAPSLSPQPVALAASAASLPSPAACSGASASRTPFFPSVPEGASSPAPPGAPGAPGTSRHLPAPPGTSRHLPAPPGSAGRAARIASFTSVTCPTRSLNRSCSATSGRAFSSSGLSLRCTARVRPLIVWAGSTADRVLGALGPRTRSSASRTCAGPRSATPAEIPDPAQLRVKLHAAALQPASSSDPSGTPPPRLSV